MTPTPPRGTRPPASRRWVPWAVLALGLALTSGFSAYAAATAETSARLRFANAAQRTLSSLQARLDTHVAMLQAGAALFRASDRVTLPEFRSFVESLELPRRHPGIQGLGFAAAGPRETLNAMLVEAHAGNPDVQLRVWPTDPRDEYTAIVYLEPLDRRNEAAVGYDMFTEPVRREAMVRARDLGRPAASGILKLVQEIDRDIQPGFLIYVPVYAGYEQPETVAERRRRLMGYVYSPFRVRDLMVGIFGHGDQRTLNFQLFEGRSPHGGALFYDSSASTERSGSSMLAEPAQFTRSDVLDIAGRTWTMRFSAGPEFDPRVQMRTAILIALLGVALSVGLFVVTRAETAARSQAELTSAELRRSEEALRAREAEALAANRAKDEFLATLSHELRTPLNAVMGWVAMLRGGKLAPERQAYGLEVVERNVRLQARLIEDLLDISRIQAGTLRHDPRLFEPRPVVQAAVESVRPQAVAAGITLGSDVRPVGLVYGDPGRLQQIVSNLLSNALKFTPPGGRVDVRLEQASDFMVLTVSDTGIGIDPAFLPYVFDRFRQADATTTRAHGGVGLGLSIARRLVELHNGTIVAESEGRGRGSTFTVRIPVAPPETLRHDVAMGAPAAAGGRRARQQPARVQAEGEQRGVTEASADPRRA